ncbi:MAG: PSP1 domain-containing protein, partial [Planctomycetota bacterium]|nr:PSP1 domain-containing protein [Planctomycetota bacterium]
MKIYKVVCRYGKMFDVAEFFSDMENIKRNSTLVVRTEQGMCIATALRPPVEAPGVEQLPEFPKVLRIATVDDLDRHKELQEVREKEAMRFCKEQIKNLGLNMRLLDVECLFGGEKILFY